MTEFWTPDDSWWTTPDLDDIEPDEHGRKFVIFPDAIEPPNPSGFWHRCRDLTGLGLQIVWGITLIFVAASILAAAVVYPIYIVERWHP